MYKDESFLSCKYSSYIKFINLIVVLPLDFIVGKAQFGLQINWSAYMYDVLNSNVIILYSTSMANLMERSLGYSAHYRHILRLPRNMLTMLIVEPWLWMNLSWSKPEWDPKCNTNTSSCWPLATNLVGVWEWKTPLGHGDELKYWTSIFKVDTLAWLHNTYICTSLHYVYDLSIDESTLIVSHFIGWRRYHSPSKSF